MKQKMVTILLGFGLAVGLMGPSWGSEGKGPGEIEKRLIQELSLPDLLEFAYVSNPSVAVSRESWQIFIENYRIGTSYPDPQLATTYFTSPIETRLGPQDWNLTLSQAIPFPGTLAQKGRVLEADVTISRLNLDKTVKLLVTQLATAYYELTYIQEAMGVAQANLDLNQQLSAISLNAYARDKAAFYDVSKAQAQTAQIHYDLLLLQELEQTEKTKINTLLNRDPDAPLGRARTLGPRDAVYSLQEIYALAMEHQEDILIAEETVEKAVQAIRLVQLETLPSFRLGLFYAGIGQPDVPMPPVNAGEDAVGIQFGMNLPLWMGKNNSLRSKSLAEREKAKAERIRVANQTQAQISRLWFKLQNSKRLMALYEGQLIPQALASVQTAETWFKEGSGSFSDFLELQATAYNFQLSLARAKTDYSQTLVSLEQLAGVLLDVKGQAFGTPGSKSDDRSGPNSEVISHEN